MKVLLTPLQYVYGGITEGRNWLFDNGHLKTNRPTCPVICVGNITAGGTGKTPLVSSLLSWSVREGLRAGVVSRGYRGSFSGIQKVDPLRADAADYYGDEPTLLAEKFLSVPVYVGADRFEAAKKLEAEHRVDFILADDAFQHRALKRDVDVVVVDSLEAKDNYRMLPAGRLREPLHNIRRANFVVLSRSNLAHAKQLEWTKEMLEQNGVRKEQIIESTIEVKALRSLVGSVPAPIPKQKVFLFSGIGNPDSFKMLVAKQYNVVGEKVFRDHHQFSAEDISKVAKLARSEGADHIFTTEKDAVKLRPLLKPNDDPIFAVEIESRFSHTIEKLWNEIIRFAR